MKQSTPKKEFLNLNEAATELGVSRFTLMRWLKEGKLNGSKRGHFWLIPMTAVTLMKQHRMSPDSVPPLEIHSLSEVPPWLFPMSTGEAAEITKDLAEFLEPFTGAIRLDGLQSIVEGRVAPDAALWRSLVRAIRWWKGGKQELFKLGADEALKAIHECRDSQAETKSEE